MNKEQTEEQKVEQTEATIIEGLEYTLSTLGPELREQVPSLSTKQLRRALLATINYITTRQDDTEASALTESEKRFLGSMFAIVDTSASYTMHIIGQLQKEALEQVNNQTTEGVE